MLKKLTSSYIVLMLIIATFVGITFISTTTIVRADPPGWWDANWTGRKLLTIESDLINKSLYNFTISYNTSDVYFIVFSQDDGDDIVFVDYSDNSTQLNHHIEHFDIDTGDLVAHFLVPFISNTTDTKIWCYFGNDNATNSQNETGSWDSHYMMVNHFNGSSYSTCLDSTSNNNDPSAGTGTYQADGKLGYAVDLETSNSEAITIPDSSSLKPPNQITLEAWIKAESLTSPTTGRILTKWTYGGVYPGYSLYRSYSQFGIQLNINNSLKSKSYSSTISTGVWHYVVMSYDNVSIKGYKDGAYVDALAASGSITHTGAVLYVGRYSGGEYFDGVIDEIRISDIGRNASWIETCYNTINGTSGFLTVGELQTTLSNIPPVAHNPQPANNAVGIVINPTLSINASDFDGDTMNITWQTNATGGWGTIGTNNSVNNGTYRQTNTSMDSYSTKYYWRVIINDGMGNTFNRTYSFTTVANVAPINSRPEPYNLSLMVDLRPQIGIYVSDFESHPMNVTFYSNASDGVNWTVIGSNNSVNNGTYRQQFPNASAYNTKYWWAVNTTDSEGDYDNDTYWFVTSKYVSTYVEPISPYNITSDTLNVSVNAQSNLDNVSLYYRYTDDNDTALYFKNITFRGYAIDGVHSNYLYYPNAHVVIDDVAYIAVYGDDRLLILDISNLSNMTEISNTGSQDAHDIVIRDNYAYMASYMGNHFFAWDISNISNPQLKDSITLPSDYGMYVAVDGSYAYVSQYTGSTGKWSIIDITNPSNLKFVNNQSESGRVWHLVKIDDILYVAIEGGGIRIYNVSNPYNISYSTTLASGKNMLYSVKELYSNGFRYLVGANSTENKVVIYNITTSLTNPTFVSNSSTTTGGAFTVYGNYGYGNYGNGFEIFNLTDVNNIQYITSVINATILGGVHELEFGYDDAWTLKNNIYNPYFIYIQGYTTDTFVAYEINYTNERNWIKYGEDLSYPFSFNFTFPNGTGYYEFYSAGQKSGALDEPLPEVYYPPDEISYHFVLNQPPDQPTNEIPANNSDYIVPETYMNVTVTDPDADNMTVEFRWQNGSLITTAYNVTNGSVASIYLPTYQLIQHDTNYSWYVVVDDGITNTTSPVWNFNTSKAWDLNGDQTVNYLDASILIGDYGKSGTPGWIPSDINNDGTVNYLDASLFVGHYGESY
jgi:hypothetical protein